MKLRKSRTLSAALVAAGLLAMPLAVSACQIPDRPVWWPKGGTTVPQGASATTVDSQALKVTKPWRRGMRQLGIDVYWVANTTDPADVIHAKARRIINYAVSLHANSISVTFPFYTYGVHSDTLLRRKTTPTPADIAIFLAQAAKSRIRVTVRPILNEDVLIKAHAWRGTIAPAHPAAWFASYTKLLLPYAKVAAAGHAKTFVVGAELNSLETSSHWPALIRAVRAVFPRELAYDENTSDFAAHDDHLPLATFGVDAWPPFNLPDSATVTQLTRAWSAWLGTHTLAVRRRAVLSEVGLAAIAGAYRDPSRWNGIGTPKIVPRVQANWYRALCAAVVRERIGGGVYWWEASFDANPAHPAAFKSDVFTFLGRPAQDVVSRCFAKLSS
jgi:Glycoside Hydrolase Family 113